MKDPEALLRDHALPALEELAGAALLLDDQLRIVAYTPSAPELIGLEPPLGVAAPKVLCGHGRERPVAEALAAGRPTSAEILRPTSDGHNRVIHVRAVPLRLPSSDRRSWLLVLSSDRSELSAGDDSDASFDHGIITRNPRMKRLLRQMRKVAQSKVSVLVRGETGSGKELIARAVHDSSPRREGPFRAINCAALPPNLLESELFGHVRGSFTGAVKDAPGHFRLADGGTLFLDEVGELPLEVQAKLLRVLQEASVIPVGGQEPVPVDVRVVSATHRALRREVEEGRFRADLLYRLRVIPLYLPALRERPDDVELLLWHFLREHRERVVSRITPTALSLLLNYDWPGNVRELQNVVEYGVVMGEGSTLSEADLPPELQDEDATHRQLDSAASLASSHLEELARELPPDAQRLINALERASGHMGRAAASLGISRTTLWRRLKKHGLDREVLSGAAKD